MFERVKLRGHHLLCLMAFKGKGYNPAFIHNLKILQERIKKEKDIKIKIVNGPDNICSVCPHLNGLICCKDGEKNNSKILSMDNNVLGKLNISQNDVVIDFLTIIRAVRQLPTDEIEEICTPCSWLKPENCPKAIRSFIHSFST